MGEGLRIRSRLAVSLAVIAIGAGLALLASAEAARAAPKGLYTFRATAANTGAGQSIDSDGNVPEYYNRVPDYDGRLIIGRAHGVVYGCCEIARWIDYDRPQMRRYCARPAQWQRLYAHERAHTRGWNHGERPKRRNSAFNPTATKMGPC